MPLAYLGMERNAPPMETLIRGTHHLSKVGAETTELRSLIQRRRLQVLVHSCIYYKLGDSLISDSLWASWASELVELQEKYPRICERVDYHREFMGFEGSTGFHLPINSPEVLAKAQQLIKSHNTPRVLVFTKPPTSGMINSPNKGNNKNLRRNNNMAKKNKAKFLEGDTAELVTLLSTTLTADDVDDKAITKAVKITGELFTRLATTAGPLSVAEALVEAADSATKSLYQIKAAYENELAMMSEDDGDDEEEEEEKAPPKSSKKSKKAKVEEPEDEEDEEDEDGYDELSMKELKAECRTRGIKVSKSSSRSDLLKALEADDEN